MPPNRVRAVTATLEGRVVPGGQAFLLAKFVDEKKSFRHYSPYKIRDQLMLILESRVDEVSALRSGALLLKTFDYEQTEALMAWTTFCGESIRVIPADRLNQVEGIVYAPELTSESPQTILEESVDQGVTSVTRLPSKTTRPNPLLKVRFSSTELPASLYAVYMRYEVRPCHPLPRRCTRCQRYGHGRGSCRAKDERCSRCTGRHTSDGCDAPPCCAACQGPHPVTDRECPVWVAKLQGLRHQTAPPASQAGERARQGPPNPRGRPSHRGNPGQTRHAVSQQTVPTSADSQEWPPLPSLTAASSGNSRLPQQTQRRKLAKQVPPRSDATSRAARANHASPASPELLTPPPAEVDHAAVSKTPDKTERTEGSIRDDAALPLTPMPPLSQRSLFYDSDDSTSRNSSDDESTPKVNVGRQRTPSPEGGADSPPTPPTPPTQRRKVRAEKGLDHPVLPTRLRERSNSEGRKNMAYRTTPQLRRSFVPDEQSS